MVEFLPPPKGLDLRAIETEAGLLVAIQREAKALDRAKKDRVKLSRDQIRLISFLAGEVRRRIESLSAEQKEELGRIRSDARDREMEARVLEVTEAVTAFVAATETPHGEVRFSLIDELRDQIQAMEANLGSDPEKYAEFLDRMADLARQLEEVKGKNALLGGLPDFT